MNIVLPPAQRPADTQAPVVRSYPALGRRGRIVKLRYQVRDDRGETAEQIAVYRGRALVRTVTRALRQTDDSIVYWVAWRAPRRPMLGRFCVRADDAAGNNGTSCATLRVR